MEEHPLTLNEYMDTLASREDVPRETWRDAQTVNWSAVTHLCPPDGSGEMPCCGLTPFEVPRDDRITMDPDLVTCRK